jgi:adenosine deaminase
VPFTLAADDEGVFRIDLTQEYVRAALEQRLTYAELKASARNGLTYSFLPGASLWEPGPGFRKVAVCRQDGVACDSFLKTSQKATLQARLEREYGSFEAKAAAGGFPN